MAKKTVASFQAGKTDGRSYTKVIKMEKSPKTGAYIFKFLRELFCLNKILMQICIFSTYVCLNRLQLSKIQDPSFQDFVVFLHKLYAYGIFQLLLEKGKKGDTW